MLKRRNETFFKFWFVSSIEILNVLILLIIKRKGEKTAFALIITPSSCWTNSKNLIPRGEVSNFFADSITENGLSLQSHNNSSSPFSTTETTFFRKEKLYSTGDGKQR